MFIRWCKLVLSGLLVTGLLSTARADEIANDRIGDRALTFEEAVALAAKNNRDLQAAQERLRGSYADVEKALATLLPTLSAQGKLTINAPDVQLMIDETTTLNIIPLAQLDGILSTNIPLVLPSAYPALQAARLAFESRKKQMGVTAAQVLTSVATTFFAAAGNDELSTARHHAIELAQKTIENATMRLNAGLVSKVEVMRAELALVQAEQRLVEAQDSRAAAYRLLATLCRIAAGSFRVQPPPDPGSELPGEQSLVDAAFEHRPELQSAQLQVRVLEQQVLSARLGWVPSLSIFGNLRLTNATSFAGRPYAFAAGLQLDWVLFDGFLRDAARRSYEAQRREALLRLEQLRDTVADEVRNGRRTAQTRRQGLRAALRSVSIARETLELVRKQYQAGTMTQLELLTAQDNLVQAEVNAAQARFDLALAAFNLRRLTGEALAPER